MNNREDTIIDRRSIEWYALYDSELHVMPSGKVGFGRWIDSLYPGMLEQDIRNSVVPYGYSGRGAAVIKLEPHDPNTQNFIIRAVSWGGSATHDLADAVAEWLRGCAQSIVADGTAAYEIASLRERASRSQTGVLLISLRWDQLRVKGRYVIQRVLTESGVAPYQAEGTEEHHHAMKQARIALNDMLLVRDPVMTRTQYEALGVLGGSRYPEFFLKSFRHRADPGKSAGAQVPFDFQEFHEAQDRAIAAATANIGWDARGGFAERQTDIYYIARRLRFERYKIALRSTIVSAINGLIGKYEKQFGLKGRVVVEGCMTMAEVEEAEAHLQAGDCSLTSLVEQFR